VRYAGGTDLRGFQGTKSTDEGSGRNGLKRPVRNLNLTVRKIKKTETYVQLPKTMGTTGEKKKKKEQTPTNQKRPPCTNQNL